MIRLLKARYFLKIPALLDPLSEKHAKNLLAKVLLLKRRFGYLNITRFQIY